MFNSFSGGTVATSPTDSSVSSQYSSSSTATTTSSSSIDGIIDRERIPYSYAINNDEIGTELTATQAVELKLSGSILIYNDLLIHNYMYLFLVALISITN